VHVGGEVAAQLRKARDARLTLVNQDGEWIIATAESPQSLTRP